MRSKVSVLSILLALCFRRLELRASTNTRKFKVGKLQSAHCGISVFRLYVLAFLLSAYIIPEKRNPFKYAKMSRVQVHKVRKRLQKKKGQKNCPKKPKKPCKTRLFCFLGVFFDLLFFAIFS